MAIPESIKQKANKIRNEVYGKDVREALASGIEEAGDIADQTRERQDSVEAQFQSVLDETTGKDVISAPEITAARVGADDTNHPNLKERLDTEYQKLSSQLAQKAEEKDLINGLLSKPNKEYVDDAVNKVEERISEIITTPIDGVNAEEIIDARHGEKSLGDNISNIKSMVETSVKNIVTNGNFVSRVDWVQDNCVTKAEDNKLTVTGDGTHHLPRVWQRTSITSAPGHKIYVRGLFKSLNTDVIRMGFALYGSSSSDIVSYRTINGVIGNKDYLLTGIVEMGSGTTGNLIVQLRSEYNSAADAEDKSIELRKILVVDLTSVFGLGNEPTVDQMDEIVDSIPNQWFDHNVKINDFQQASAQVALKYLRGLSRDLSDKTFNAVNQLPVNKNKFDTETNEVYRFTSAELRYNGSNVSTDELIRFEGNNTVKLTSTGGEDAFVLYNLGERKDLSDHDYVDIYLHIDSILNLGATQIDLMKSPSLSNKFSFYLIQPRLRAVQENGWRYLRIPKKDFVEEGDISWSEINYVRVVTRSSSGTVNVNVGKIDYTKVEKGAIYMFFDDGTSGQYENAFRIMEKYGLRGTINVVTSWVGNDNFVTWSQLREMEQAGWVVCSHTHTHQRLWNMSDEEVRYECETSSRMLFDRGFYFGSKCMVAPFGAYSARVDRVAREYFAIVRSNAYDNRNNPSMEHIHSHPRHQYYISPHNTDDLDIMSGWVDNVIDNKESLAIAFHRVDDSQTQYTTPVDVFEEFCAYVRGKVDEGVLDVVTWKDTIAQSQVMQPIDTDGIQYIISDNGKPSVLTLPIE